MGALYGTSINASDPLLRALTDDGAILRQWVLLQLGTKTGFYWSAPEVGADVVALVLRGMTPAQVAAIPGQVQAALEVDQRISRVEVSASTTYTPIGDAAVKLGVVVYPKAASVAPFSFSAIASRDLFNTIARGS